jgi:hypothetical protein
MPKKPRKLNGQEAFGASVAQYSISATSMFHPKQWRNGREPADMIIQVGRAVLFFNLTDGRRFFAQMAEHNIQQARDRMAEWAGGLSIKGENQAQRFDIRWEDVDHIAVISVVDGRYARCMDHPLAGLNLDPKVRICSSITSDCLDELARRMGGARDLIRFCVALKTELAPNGQNGRRIVRAMHKKVLDASLATVAKIPTRVEPRLDGNGREIPLYDYFASLLNQGRQQQKDPVNHCVDLDWQDIYQTAAFLTNQTAEREWLEDGGVAVTTIGAATKLQVILSTSAEVLRREIPQLLKRGEREGCAMNYIVEVTSLGPMPMMTMDPDLIPKGTAALLAGL